MTGPVRGDRVGIRFPGESEWTPYILGEPTVRGCVGLPSAPDQPRTQFWDPVEIAPAVECQFRFRCGKCHGVRGWWRRPVGSDEYTREQWFECGLCAGTGWIVYDPFVPFPTCALPPGFIPPLHESVAGALLRLRPSRAYVSPL